MLKFKKGDEVLVTSGKEKGKRGKVERFLVNDLAVIVSGLNKYKRHQKARGQDNKGGIVELLRPLPFGNLMVICPKCSKPARVGFTVKDKKLRVCRKCNEVIE